MNALKILTIIVPLITYPYLIKTLGTELYGQIIWLWAITEIFIIFINFGFDITTTKDISINRENKKIISRILSYTIVIKLCFLLISFSVLLSIINFFDLFKIHSQLFLVVFLIAIPESLMPLWYFKGIERMKYVAIIVSLTKILFAILVFLFIEEKNDYILVPISYFISGMISVIFAYYIILFKDKIHFSRFKLTDIWTTIKNSSSVFGSNSIMVIREKFNLILIERFVGLEALAFFDIIQKFVNVLITPFHIMASTIYPYISKNKNINFAIKITIISFFISIAIYVLQFIFSDNLVTILYGKYNQTLELILIILSLTIPFGTISAFIGINFLVVFNKSKYYFYSSLIATSFYFIIFFIFYMSNYNFNIYWFTITTSVIFFVEMFSRVIFAKDLILQRKG